MRTMPIRTILAVILSFFAVSPAAAQEAKPDPAKHAGESAQREKQFAEKLSGSKLQGYWTLWGKEDQPKRDSYTLAKVTKLKGDNWRFDARIQYGKIDLTVPVIVQVKWAGDTPVITVDKVGIPGLGTYSARVVFHGDHYAATWDGGDHGGHMFGKVVKLDKPEKKP